jgi:hypothetical protein
MNSYYKTKAVGSLADNAATSINNSGFFEDYGTYIGLFLSAIYIIGSIYFIYSLYKSEDGSKKEYYIIPILFLLLGIIDILYFVFNMNNTNMKQVNNIVGHISMIPIYLLIVAILIGFLLSK